MKVGNLVTWEKIEQRNAELCDKGAAQHGRTSEGYEAALNYFQEIQDKRVDLVDLADEFRTLHKLAPFLFLNGNTFNAVYEEVISRKVSGFIHPETKSILAHHISGVSIIDDMEVLRDVLPDFIEPQEEEIEEIEKIEDSLSEGMKGDRYTLEAVDHYLGKNCLSRGEKELTLFEMSQVADEGKKSLSDFKEGLGKRLEKAELRRKKRAHKSQDFQR